MLYPRLCLTLDCAVPRAVPHPGLCSVHCAHGTPTHTPEFRDQLCEHLQFLKALTRDRGDTESPAEIAHPRRAQSSWLTQQKVPGQSTADPLIQHLAAPVPELQELTLYMSMSSVQSTQRYSFMHY